MSRWERFRFRKECRYGSFGRYVEKRGIQLLLVVLTALLGAIVMSAMIGLPAVSS